MKILIIALSLYALVVTLYNMYLKQKIETMTRINEDYRDRLRVLDPDAFRKRSRR
jgi:hypothetical protein